MKKNELLCNYIKGERGPREKFNQKMDWFWDKSLIENTMTIKMLGLEFKERQTNFMSDSLKTRSPPSIKYMPAYSDMLLHVIHPFFNHQSFKNCYQICLTWLVPDLLLRFCIQVISLAIVVTDKFNCREAQIDSFF